VECDHRRRRGQRDQALSGLLGGDRQRSGHLL